MSDVSEEINNDITVMIFFLIEVPLSIGLFSQHRSVSDAATSASSDFADAPDTTPQ